QSTAVCLGPAIFKFDVISFDVTFDVQPLVKSAEPCGVGFGRSGREHPNHRLLRTRGEWPCRRRSANESDEVAPSHALSSGRCLKPSTSLDGAVEVHGKIGCLCLLRVTPGKTHFEHIEPASPQRADMEQTCRGSRFAPIPDSCTAASCICIQAPRG